MKSIGVLFGICFCISQSFSQIKPQITSNVDTTKNEIKEILFLYTNYLNSHPDSAYNNPYWNTDEPPIQSTGHRLPSDRFFWANYWFGQILKKCRLTVLAIDKSYNSSSYIIRTLINYDSANIHRNGKLMDPPYISIYYAEKTSNGWKLENAIKEETKTWNHYNTRYIHYIYPPEFNFHKDIANKADSFCSAILDTFRIQSVETFDYYITTGIEQMGRLFNMEYWGSPTYGYTIFAARQIVSARATEYPIHEFTHMLLPHSKNSFVNEGIATYFAGPGDESFEKGLIDLSNELKSNDTISFSDIYSFRFFHPFDSKPYYITSAVVCMFIFDKKGIDGLKDLIKCPGNSEDDFDKTVLKILEIDKKSFEKKIISFIKNYTSSKRTQK